MQHEPLADAVPDYAPEPTAALTFSGAALNDGGELSIGDIQITGFHGRRK